jgi:molybdopterin-containing oxidoreductase family membrane subunit
MKTLLAKTALWIIWIALAVVGALGVVERFVHGHDAAAYGSYIVWGLWVSAYIYFIGLSAGAFLLSSLIYVFGVRQLERVGKISLFVAIITLFMALVSILFDLGRMERFYRVFTAPSFTSMMAWMVWLYAGYFLLLLVEMWFALRPDLARWATETGWRGFIGRTLALSKKPLTPVQLENDRGWLRWLGTFGIPLAVAFHGGVGALFGTVSARAYWHAPLVPILFLTGALVSGGALMAFVVATFWPNRDAGWREAVSYLGQAVLVLLVFDLLLEWAEFSIPMWYRVRHEFELLKQVMFGEFWWVFWIVHILLGSAIPLALLIFARYRPWAVGLAGMLIAVSFMAVRLNIVIPGLIAPNLRELQTAFIHPRLAFQYVPSFFEWQVTFAMIALGIAIFFLGCKLLPLREERRAT